MTTILSIETIRDDNPSFFYSLTLDEINNLVELGNIAFTIGYYIALEERGLLDELGKKDLEYHRTNYNNRLVKWQGRINEV